MNSLIVNPLNEKPMLKLLADRVNFGFVDETKAKSYPKSAFPYIFGALYAPMSGVKSWNCVSNLEFEVCDVVVTANPSQKHPNGQTLHSNVRIEYAAGKVRSVFFSDFDDVGQTSSATGSSGGR